MSQVQFDVVRGFAAQVLRSRTALTVFAGNAAGQVVALAAVPIIARLFDAPAVGTFGLFTSVVASLAVVACLALDQAIPLATDRREAQALRLASVAALAGFVLVLVLALWAADALGLQWLRMLGPNVALVPPAVLLAGLVQVSVQSATQRRDFDALSRGFAVRTGGTALAQIGMAFVLRNGTGMIVGQMLAVATALALLRGGGGRAVLSWRRAWLVALRHRNCPCYLAPRLAVGSLGGVAVLVVVSAWFRPEEVGYFWMAGRLLQVPAGFIDAPTRQLFMSAALDARARTGRFGSVLLASMVGLLAVSGAFTLLLLVGGHPLIRTLLGAAWEPAVPYVQILAFGWIFEFASIPVSNAVLLLGLQRQHFMFDVVQRVLVLAGLGIGCLNDDLLLGCAMAAAVRAVLATCFAAYLIAQSFGPERTAAVVQT